VFLTISINFHKPMSVEYIFSIAGVFTVAQLWPVMASLNCRNSWKFLKKFPQKTIEVFNFCWKSSENPDSQPRGAGSAISHRGTQRAARRTAPARPLVGDLTTLETPLNHH
jgi:hypothetical protein